MDPLRITRSVGAVADARLARTHYAALTAFVLFAAAASPAWAADSTTPAVDARFGKVEFSTVGSAPQVLTAGELRKVREAAALPAPAAVPLPESLRGFGSPFDQKEAELKTFLPLPDFARIAGNPTKYLEGFGASGTRSSAITPIGGGGFMPMGGSGKTELERVSGVKRGGVR